MGTTMKPCANCYEKDPKGCVRCAGTGFVPLTEAELEAERAMERAVEAMRSFNVHPEGGSGAGRSMWRKW